MIFSLRFAPHRRRLVAVAAAYGLALHGLLSVLAGATPPLDPVLCAADVPGHGGVGRNAPPASHWPDCAACPLVCGGAAVPPRAAAIVPTGAVREIPPLQPILAAPRPAPPRSGLARAPPA